ncbi:Hypothetical protein A7982_06611 [Minicystis rosea]|nr:Hypothetical protein A7982_06611 [Minicystis rosea]
MSHEHAVILVGHGAPPRGYPRDELSRLKALESRRHATGGPMSDEEAELDRRVRAFPRTADNDPYREGLTALADAMRPLLGGTPLHVAYNEFCAPTIEEAITLATQSGARTITIVPSMLTPGGVHSEVEIPEAITRAAAQHPGVEIRYAWPFDLRTVAQMLATQAGLPSR